MTVERVLKIITRGGVEDTRLEAKAKDTKKIRGQGQGQPFRGQTLSRPRTGMLEAKAKDQGHKAQVLSKKKKKGLHKNFSGDLQKKKKKKKKRSSQKFFKRSPLQNVFQKIFQPLQKILTFQKILLSSSQGQANFRGLEASRPRTSKCVLEDVLEAKDVLEDSTSDNYHVLLECEAESKDSNNFIFELKACFTNDNEVRDVGYHTNIQFLNASRAALTLKLMVKRITVLSDTLRKAISL